MNERQRKGKKSVRETRRRFCEQKCKREEAVSVRNEREPCQRGEKERGKRECLRKE